ncbi:MAG TPA: prolyl oligopeptidase family serine peptidase [Nocardioides sp.]|nr:prolyl oligopeptidase family serine peptidase [Nocardioides sp.]
MTSTTTEPMWAARFRAARVTLPDWADDAPDRSVYASNASGVVEIYAWDRTADTHRQVTDRPNGTMIADIDPAGEQVWWFADTDGDEWGVWMTQPFRGGADTPAVPDLGPSYPGGLEIGRSSVVVGRSTDDGSSVHLVHGGAPSTLYSHANDAHVGGLSRDETLVCIAHSEHGDSRHMALRVLRADGSGAVADLWDGPGKGLEPAGFAPVAGDQRFLAIHERRGRPELLVWDPASGSQEEIALDLPGEVYADWYPDGTALLVGHDHAARSELYRYDLANRSLSRVHTPLGVVSGATARPDGAIEFAWSSSEAPPAIRDAGGAVVLEAPGATAPRSVPVEDAWIDGPGGPIHALIARPSDGPAPYATVFAIHGGPSAADVDAFRPRRAAFVDAGYCVVHVNYRGSTGYGSTWRDALEGRPGLTELDDIAAVRAWMIDQGVADADRCILEGGSWGGYLTLLGLGVEPKAWAAGLAAVPVADYVAAYEDEMEPLRAFDRAIFGGSPNEVPEVYERCSPITYVDAVRAPVLVLAGANDPRCPIRQIDNYLGRLNELGKPHEVYRFDAGHGSLVVDEQIRQMAAELDFVGRHVPARR